MASVELFSVPHSSISSDCKTVNHNSITKSAMRNGSDKPGIVYPSSTERPAFSSEWVNTAPSGYTISEHLLGEPPISQEPFRILCLGAGASGIDFLHHAVTLDLFKGLNVEIRCYEKNHDVGGTWLENRYIWRSSTIQHAYTNTSASDTLAVHVTFPVSATSSNGNRNRTGPASTRGVEKFGSICVISSIKRASKSSSN
jgi:hypothetical protein